jgi:hypothetical protein
MRMTPAMRAMLKEYLMTFQMFGPYPFGQNIFGQHADILWEKIEAQREKDEAERRELEFWQRKEA